MRAACKLDFEKKRAAYKLNLRQKLTMLNHFGIDHCFLDTSTRVNMDMDRVLHPLHPSRSQNSLIYLLKENWVALL